jgi:uncharacterized protein (DUF4415 family)
MSISEAWVDPDDAPELSAQWFERAQVKDGGKPVRKSGRPPGSMKEQVSLRLDKDVVARFRATGPGWQTRINEALRRALI